MNVQDILTLLLGGGAVTTIAAFFKGVKTLREGARSREKDVISDLRTWREESNEERELAERQRDYWRDKAAEYRYRLMNEFGVDLPSEQPPVRKPKEVEK